jgi:hypothetical protein
VGTLSRSGTDLGHRIAFETRLQDAHETTHGGDYR